MRLRVVHPLGGSARSCVTFRATALPVVGAGWLFRATTLPLVGAGRPFRATTLPLVGAGRLFRATTLHSAAVGAGGRLAHTTFSAPAGGAFGRATLASDLVSVAGRVGNDVPLDLHCGASRSERRPRRRRGLRRTRGWGLWTSHLGQRPCVSRRVASDVPLDLHCGARAQSERRPRRCGSRTGDHSTRWAAA